MDNCGNFKKRLYSQTLDEVFLFKRDSNAKDKTNNLKENSSNYDSKKLRTITKTSSENLSQTINNRSNLNKLSKNQIANSEHMSDDEIMQNSQYSNKSKMKNNIRKSLSEKSKTSVVMPETNILFDTSKKTPSVSDIGEIDSVIIKEEFLDTYENIDESIEMTHDLSGVMFNTKLFSNNLEYSPLTINNSTIMESIKEEKDILEEEQIQDPLLFDDKHKDETNQTKIMKIRNTSDSSSNTIFQRHLVNDQKDQTKISTVCNNFINKRNRKKVKNHNSQDNQNNDELLPNNLIQKLKSLKIKLQHEVPPQHKIETLAGSKTLNKKQLIKFESYGPLKKGQYTKNENKIIKRNWKHFCDIHDWNEKNIIPFLCTRHNGKYYLKLKERKKFVQFLANGLPWRSLYSVYHRFRNLVNVVKAGKYTPKEDKIIIKYMIKESNSELKKSYTEVAKILNRKSDSVWYRFKTLCQQHNFKNAKVDSTLLSTSTFERNIEKYQEGRALKLEKPVLNNRTNQRVQTNVTWTYPIVKNFIYTLIVTSSSKLENLKYININQSTWNKIEKCLNIDQKILENFWYFQLHMQIFCPGPIYLNDLKIKLIQYMYEKEINVLADIAWENVCLNFDGITPIFLSKLFEQIIQYAKTKIISIEIKDIMQYLYHEYIPELEQKSIDIILPKLYCKNNKIIFVDKGKEKKIPNRITMDPLNENV